MAPPIALQCAALSGWSDSSTVDFLSRSGPGVEMSPTLSVIPTSNVFTAPQIALRPQQGVQLRSWPALAADGVLMQVNPSLRKVKISSGRVGG